MTRSPVNSITASRLRHRPDVTTGRGSNSRVHFHPAAKSKVPVHRPSGRRHLQHHGVVDPVAHGESFQSSIGDRRRERDRCGIERRDVQMKIHCTNIARHAAAAAGSLRSRCSSPRDPRRVDREIPCRRSGDPDCLFARTLIRTTIVESGGSTLNLRPESSQTAMPRISA